MCSGAATFREAQQRQEGSAHERVGRWLWHGRDIDKRTPAIGGAQPIARYVEGKVVVTRTERLRGRR